MINSFELKFNLHGPSNFYCNNWEKVRVWKCQFYIREMTHVVFKKCNCEFCTVCSLSQACFFSKCSNQLFEIERWLMQLCFVLSLKNCTCNVISHDMRSIRSYKCRLIYSHLMMSVLVSFSLGLYIFVIMVISTHI